MIYALFTGLLSNSTIRGNGVEPEDGSDYDDDVGGPAYVAGRDGVNIEPLAPAQDAAARLAAQKLFEQIEQNAR